MEIWKDIEGYENKYQVSNLGNVKSLETWTGDKYIRNVDNLEWCTQSENMKHASKIGLRKYISYRNR